MPELQQKNTKTLLITLAAVAGMIALSFASVPLYRTICQATGLGGTTQNVAKNASKIYNRVITVQFNADTSPNLPWTFRPEQRQIRVKVGSSATIRYFAGNNSTLAIVGQATDNVTPLKAGKYFKKTQCFCFKKQVLQPGQKVHMPVSFFIDPKVMDDPSMDDVNTITLSYTFFRLEKEGEKPYNNNGK